MPRVILTGSLAGDAGCGEIRLEGEVVLEELLREVGRRLKRRREIGRFNTLILVNGVESRALGEGAVVRGDDEVVLIPFTHGG